MNVINKLMIPLPVFLLTCCGWVLGSPGGFALTVGIFLVTVGLFWAWASEEAPKPVAGAAKGVFLAILWGCALAISCTVAGIEHEAIQTRITTEVGL